MKALILFFIISIIGCSVIRYRYVGGDRSNVKKVIRKDPYASDTSKTEDTRVEDFFRGRPELQQRFPATIASPYDDVSILIASTSAQLREGCIANNRKKDTWKCGGIKFTLDSDSILIAPDSTLIELDDPDVFYKISKKIEMVRKSAARIAGLEFAVKIEPQDNHIIHVALNQKDFDFGNSVVFECSTNFSKLIFIDAVRGKRIPVRKWCMNNHNQFKKLYLTSLYK